MCHPIAPPLPPVVFVLLPQKLEKKIKAKNAASISLALFFSAPGWPQTKMKLVELQGEKRG